ncbi:MAG: hypothetical protein NTV33_12570 [Coprothermobacterota bacterium]|nr:hypothetical protein [Coprothermobacterota bacterium]
MMIAEAIVQLKSDYEVALLDQERVENYLCDYPKLAPILPQLVHSTQQLLGRQIQIILQAKEELSDRHLDLIIRRHCYEGISHALDPIILKCEELLKGKEGRIHVTTDLVPI